jgi:predicted GIY-YIG superfamily endonuclease
MKKIILINLLLLLVFTLSIEAKGSKGKVLSNGIKAIATATKSLLSKRAKSNARKIISSNISKRQSGLYQFKASNGKKYIGKSVDMNRRLKEHIRSGKLHPKDVKTIKTVNINKKNLMETERKEISISDKTSKGNLANKHNAPWSREKSKTLKISQEKKEELKKELFKTEF